jgi:flavin reductase (DIM6/NTAB) family NADH-FMN oxidoreductase RutF
MIQVIDTKELRSALGTFVSGITVVTTRESDGTLRGFTANSFTSVSLDPPLVLVCLSNTADCYSAFRSAASFAINVLSEEQRHVSSAFASKSDDKFREIEYRLSGSGSPLIVGTCAWFDCVSHDTVDAGDHAILIGRVVEFEHAPASPLGYCRGAYISFSLSQELPMTGNHPVCVGAILERDGRILFTVTDEGKLRLPVGRSIGTDSDPTSLFGRLRRLALRRAWSFCFRFSRIPGPHRDRHRSTIAASSNEISRRVVI